MQRTARWTLALLAFAVLATAPMMAADFENPVTRPSDLELPALEEQLEEPSAQTPILPPSDVEMPTHPGQELFFEALEVCDETRFCPSPSCLCLRIRNEVSCFC